MSAFVRAPFLGGVVLVTIFLMLNVAVDDIDACAATVTTPTTCGCTPLENLPYIGFTSTTLNNPLSFVTPSDDFGEVCQPSTIICSVLPGSAPDDIDFLFGTDLNTPVAVSASADPGDTVSADVTCTSSGNWAFNGVQFDKLSC